MFTEATLTDRVHDFGLKPTNPKDLIGSNKVPLDLVPVTSMAYQALGHLEGDLKYGLVNWRETGVKTSVYLGAMLRHLGKFINGEDADATTHVPHLGSMLASLGIIVDAKVTGHLVDDRPKSAVEVSAWLDSLEDNVRHLRTLYADKNPVHYTIQGPMRMHNVDDLEAQIFDPTPPARDIMQAHGDNL